jgi:hypothetical protein
MDPWIFNQAPRHHLDQDVYVLITATSVFDMYSKSGHVTVPRRRLFDSARRGMF